MARTELPRLRRPLAICHLGIDLGMPLAVSHLLVVSRLRARAACSFATSLAFSYSTNEPAICHIILRD
jgi:hypothetical protein